MTRFPGNKRFAFTVFDDTDNGTLENIAPVYRLLADIGMLTTKSVWPLAADPRQRIAGESLQDKEYFKFICDLQERGFEIGLHNVQNCDATREVIERGFVEFRRLLGSYPRTHCNHLNNRENVYWGSNRISSAVLKLMYNLATRFSRHQYFQGHVPGSPYFWGDLCREHISYVRNFVFDEINLDRINCSAPYHDPRKPYVNYWYSSSQGGTVDQYCNMLSEENQARLESEGGVCIMYTHFANGFCANGRIHQRFEQLMRRLARRNGWFVPVVTLLDHLKDSRKQIKITSKELRRLEARWLVTKLRNGTS